ncbi:carbohydrate kinase family protein [Desertivirga xinjiangensis]|uniref:carbohydrate kinase family protein n=1 Tax=Desertivirga xinjiangensis TaxID=539206 RepID=UPI00210EB1BE|nr:carbohydrate kinase [Pedobacter xinjiangensis]
MHQCVSFGEVLWDNFASGKKAGGAPMNVALHLHKQGIDSKMISSVGKDPDGVELTGYLQDQGLDTSLIAQHAYLPTGVVEVKLDADHQAEYDIVKSVAWDEIYFSDELEDVVSKSDVMVFGSLACRSEISKTTLLKLLPSARFKVFDMNLRPPHFAEELVISLMGACDVLKINEVELDHLAQLFGFESGSREAQLRQLKKQVSIPTICVTLGSEGAMVLHNERLLKHQGFKVVPVDTVGAGDAFLATFIASYLKGLPVELTLERACAAGALVASKSGANPEYTEEDILKMIK